MNKEDFINDPSGSTLFFFNLNLLDVYIVTLSVIKALKMFPLSEQFKSEGQIVSNYFFV